MAGGDIGVLFVPVDSVVVVVVVITEWNVVEVEVQSESDQLARHQ